MSNTAKRSCSEQTKQKLREFHKSTSVRVRSRKAHSDEEWHYHSSLGDASRFRNVSVGYVSMASRKSGAVAGGYLFERTKFPRS